MSNVADDLPPPSANSGQGQAQQEASGKSNAGNEGQAFSHHPTIDKMRNMYRAGDIPPQGDSSRPPDAHALNVETASAIQVSLQIISIAAEWQCHQPNDKLRADEVVSRFAYAWRRMAAVDTHSVPQTRQEAVAALRQFYSDAVEVAAMGVGSKVSTRIAQYNSLEEVSQAIHIGSTAGLTPSQVGHIGQTWGLGNILSETERVSENMHTITSEVEAGTLPQDHMTLTTALHFAGSSLTETIITDIRDYQTQVDRLSQYYPALLMTQIARICRVNRDPETVISERMDQAYHLRAAIGTLPGVTNKDILKAAFEAGDPAAALSTISALKDLICQAVDAGLNRDRIVSTILQQPTTAAAQERIEGILGLRASASATLRAEQKQAEITAARQALSAMQHAASRASGNLFKAEMNQIAVSIMIRARDIILSVLETELPHHADPLNTRSGFGDLCKNYVRRGGDLSIFSDPVKLRSLAREYAYSRELQQ